MVSGAFFIRLTFQPSGAVMKYGNSLLCTIKSHVSFASNALLEMIS